ncbi:DNAH6 [Symbiodinium pilosum]|uniref:DNAH6 protein n=1 Tax=Symbiodinium pilosum TaxID=2952 RepID=A0A812LPX8_SYMPI|nr:DNAH6 [Symbiodinium pilosum]
MAGGNTILELKHHVLNGRLAQAKKLIAASQISLEETADEDGNTPLHWLAQALETKAPEATDQEMLAFLLQNGAPKNRQNSLGETPLMSAVRLFLLDEQRALVLIEELLSKARVDPSRCDMVGETPLMEAAAAGLDGLGEVLLNHRANPLAESSSGLTALQLAQEYKQEAFVTLLKSPLAERAAMEARKEEASGRCAALLAQADGTLLVVDVSHLEQKEWTDMLLQKDWEARRQAVQALGRLPLARGNARAVELVCGCLEDSDALVRRAALDSGVRLLLPEPAGEEASEEEAASAAKALAEAQASSACCGFIDKVLQRLRCDEDWGVRRVALASLGAAAPRGTEPALAALKPFLADADDDVRAAAAAAAGRLAPIGDEVWIAPLIKLLQDDDEGVRQAALLAVARTAPKGHRGALEAVGDVMDDDDAAQSELWEVISARLLNELYGFSNINTGEWTDGLVALLVREAVSDTSDNKKWVVFDGPVDAIWIENMNTVLDDNKMLCLANGERIKHCSHCRSPQ